MAFYIARNEIGAHEAKPGIDQEDIIVNTQSFRKAGSLAIHGSIGESIVVYPLSEHEVVELGIQDLQDGSSMSINRDTLDKLLEV